MIRLLAIIGLVTACHAASSSEASDGGGVVVTDRRPLILLLHGYGGNLIWNQWRIEDIKSYGVFMKPNGSSDPHQAYSWNASHSACDQGFGNDDTTRLITLVEDTLARDPSIDRGSVFVWGRSCGGFMALRLACARPDLFAAVVEQAGAANSASDPACVAGPPVAYLHVHGTADTQITYDRPGWLLSMPEMFVAATGPGGTLDQLAQRNHCQGELVETGGHLAHDLDAPAPETDVLAYEGCDAAVVEWRMNGSAHVPTFSGAWPIDVLNWSLAHAREPAGPVVQP
jgi:polyhydroxybutyrate depolymerase